jgi:thiol:disulfide interchange protein/DsbC/DsbD-like thiol-disulfide interchange protein
MTLRPSALRLLIGLLLLPALAFPAESPETKKGAVAVQLVSDAAAIAPGKPFTVALRLQHDPHWHSYWIAPGTGYPTSLAWTLPDGFKAGEIQWPTPHIVKDREGKITGNGYEHEAFLLVEITPAANLAAGSTVKLEALAEWLMCETVCMPGDAKLEISFPVGEAAGDAKWAEPLAKARGQLPVANNAWDVTARHDGHTLTLSLAPKANVRLSHQPKDLHFFAADGFNDYAKPQVVRAEGGGWVIESPLDAAADKAAKRLVGVLASGNGWEPGSGYRGMVIDVPMNSGQQSAVSSQTADQSPQVSGSRSQVSPPSSLLGTLFLALVGGLVLNLMPCVFPVLGIKILGFVNQAGSDKSKVIMHGLVFTAGVLLSFWALAGALLALRAGGQELGWGAQLQYPTFVFTMAAFLLVFALNLSGLFEIGLSATGVGASLQMKSGYAGSFFTGALAVLVATPCSAPFLAPALGAAFATSISPGESLLIFTCIGIGLSAPYLLLSIFPQMIRFLPRPGAWMETFKQLMAFPLYATVGALLWVLAAQTADDYYALLFSLSGLVLIAMAAWVYGRFGQAHGKPGRQRFGLLAAAVLLVAGMAVGWPREQPSAATAGATAELTWEKWSPEAVAAAQQAGRIVYVDFTAKWCFTCQTNKAAVFSSEAVLAEIRAKNVLLLRADWTNRDAAITAELARWNRSAVPFNLIYAPGKPEPVVLPELLTPGTVLEKLAQAGAK